MTINPSNRDILSSVVRSKMRLGVRTVYFPFLLVSGVLIGTLFLSAIQSGVTRNQCITTEIGQGQLVVVPEQTTASDGLNTEFARAIEDRKTHLDKACDTDDNVTFYRDVREHLLYHVKSNLVFCYVPKVASTLWKTVFHLIDKPGLSQVELGEEILHMRKGYIHTVRLPWIASIRPFSHVFAFLTDATRVMFTRDPYARLFSAYIDKLMLPSFWKPVGMAIVKSQRRGANPLSKECGHDVTFEEFLRHIVDVNSEPALIKYGIDDHWIPVSWICQPCQMDYDFIGKIETFTSDRDTVLGNVMGLRETVHYLRSNKLGAENFLNQAINTSWFAVVNFKKCVTKVDIMSRLWHSFKVQGYLPMALPLPVKILSHEGTNFETKENFRAFVIDSYEKHGLTHEESSAQRRAAMAKAYQILNVNVKKDIVKTFVRDFEIFNYEKYPEDLYRFDEELLTGIQN